MDGYVSKAIRKKKIFRVVPSTGAVEDSSRALEVDAYDKHGAEREYRKRMKERVHVLEPLYISLVEDNKDTKMKGRAEWLQR